LYNLKDTDEVLLCCHIDQEVGRAGRQERREGGREKGVNWIEKRKK
jgi:hypothetical protein